MILLELYSIRASIFEASFDNNDIKDGVKKIDNLISLMSNAPSAENNSNFPKSRLRR